jgi:hypothetical protein
MGAFSTTHLGAAPQSDSATAESARPAAWAIVSRLVAWVIFAGGLVGAVMGIVELRVLVTVAGLILACTAGLVLLKIRADAHGSA